MPSHAQAGTGQATVRDRNGGESDNTVRARARTRREMNGMRNEVRTEGRKVSPGPGGPNPGVRSRATMTPRTCLGTVASIAFRPLRQTGQVTDGKRECPGDIPALAIHRTDDTGHEDGTGEIDMERRDCGPHRWTRETSAMRTVLTEFPRARAPSVQAACSACTASG